MKGFVLLAIISSACTISVSGGTISTTTDAAIVAATAPVTVSAPASTTTTTTTVAATTTTTAPPTRAIHTKNGVPVAVLSKTESGYAVRTTCGEIDFVTGGEPIIEATVVLDPGHGGPMDTGAVGRNGLREKDINLDVALATQLEMQDRGLSVVLTRTGDYAVPLSNRAAFADHLRAELMVSIHHNAPTPKNSPTPGTEVFVQSESADSARLGGLVWEHLVGALSVFDISWVASRDAGVLTVFNTRGLDAYGMIREPSTVTVLAELLYISSLQEAGLMLTEDYLDVTAKALANAIDGYLNTDAPGSGYVDKPRVFNPRPRVSAALCEEAVLE